MVERTDTDGVRVRFRKAHRRAFDIAPEAGALVGDLAVVVDDLCGELETERRESHTLRCQLAAERRNRMALVVAVEEALEHVA